MDPIFHPDERNWISGEVRLDETMSKIAQKAKIFFSDIEEVRRENRDLFKPQEAPRPSQEELAAILKPYDHIYEKPSKSKRKNKADAEAAAGLLESEIALEDGDVIEDTDNDSNSDLSDSEIKLKLVSPDDDERLEMNILLDSDEGEDFFESFDSFKTSLYTNYIRDLKKRSRERTKGDVGYDENDELFAEVSTDSDEDEDYEGGEETPEDSEGTSEESDEEEAKINDKNDKKGKETSGETPDEDEEMDVEVVKIDDKNEKKGKDSSVDLVIDQMEKIFGLKKPAVEGRKVGFSGTNNKTNDGTVGRPRRTAAAYTDSPSVKAKGSLSGPGPKTNTDNNKAPTTTNDVYVQDGQVPGPSSILKKTLPLPNSNNNNDNNGVPPAGPNLVKKTGKTVTISDDKEKEAEAAQKEEEEAVKTEMDDFKNFFENSYKVKLAALKNSWMLEDREAFKKALKMDNKEFEETRQSINPSLLTIPEEFLMDSPIMKMGSMPVLCGPIPTAGSRKLASLAMLKFANIGRGLGDFFWKSPIVLDQMTMDQQVTDRNLRTRENKLRQAEEMTKPVHLRNPDLVDMDDFIMTIKVYQNFKNDDIIADQLNLNLEPKFLYEIQILASQTLAELRQMLTCENDYVCMVPFDHPHQYDPAEESCFAKHHMDGAIINIGTKLYMNLKNRNSLVMAQRVIEWGEDAEDKKVGPFEMASHFDTKIKDLVIRFGFPYVFIHLGNCEHLMVFTTSKMITAEDRLERSSYPRRSEVGKLRITNCNVDNENMAKWAVVGCDRFPSSQMMICEDCLLTYCYDSDGQKIGNFRLFPIINIAGKL